MTLVPNRSPDSLVDFATLERDGAQNPVKVKFMAGYNTGMRHQRSAAPALSGVARADRSVPFLAGYDAALIDHPRLRPQTTAEIEAGLQAAYAAYMNGHHGTNLTWDAKPQ